jgi:hypothetical protein
MKELYKLVKDPVGRKDIDKHSADHNGGYKVGQVTYILNDFLILGIPYFIQKYCQYDGGRKAPNEPVKTDEQGITYQFPEIRIDNEFAKVLEPDPGAAHNALHDIVVLEGQDDSIHRRIMKYDIISEWEEENEIEPGALPDLLYPWLYTCHIGA